MGRKNKKTSPQPCAANYVWRFEFQYHGSGKVCLAGSFNDWHPNATPMVALGDGRWVKEISLPPGRYEYRFVVNGQWMNDPNAKETAPNPHGGVNAVLTVR